MSVKSDIKKLGLLFSVFLICLVTHFYGILHKYLYTTDKIFSSSGPQQTDWEAQELKSPD